MPNRKRFTFVQVEEALKRTGFDDEAISAACRNLLAIRHEGIDRGGRPLEDDAARIDHAKALIRGNVTAWTAAAMATSDLPESSRGTARKRIYRKLKLP